jgi:hypothetical protein
MNEQKVFVSDDIGERDERGIGTNQPTVCQFCTSAM